MTTRFWPSKRLNREQGKTSDSWRPSARELSVASTHNDISDFQRELNPYDETGMPRNATSHTLRKRCLLFPSTYMGVQETCDIPGITHCSRKTSRKVRWQRTGASILRHAPHLLVYIVGHKIRNYRGMKYIEATSKTRASKLGWLPK
jgi:hypothetical protein